MLACSLKNNKELAAKLEVVESLTKKWHCDCEDLQVTYNHLRKDVDNLSTKLSNLNKASHALKVIKNSQRPAGSLKGISFEKESNQTSTSAGFILRLVTALRHVAGEGKEKVEHKIGLPKYISKIMEASFTTPNAHKTGT